MLELIAVMELGVVRGSIHPHSVNDFEPAVRKSAALRLMTYYRLKIDEVLDARAVTSYTRWVDAVQVRGAENEDICVTFSPRFEHI